MQSLVHIAYWWDLTKALYKIFLEYFCLIKKELNWVVLHQTEKVGRVGEWSETTMIIMPIGLDNYVRMLCIRTTYD